MFRDTDIGSEFTNYYLIELYTLSIVFQTPKKQTLNVEVSKNWNESCFAERTDRFNKRIKIIQFFA